MHAEDLVLDAGGERQPVEQGVETRPRPDAVRVPQSLDALYSKAEQGVDVRSLGSGM